LFSVIQACNPISTSHSTADFQKQDYSEAKIALENVLNSQTFSEMSRLRRFLEYVVSETIEGRGDRLKGVVIACDVFDKTDPDEAQSTTIVRVEAGRLRRRLDDYYRREGKNEPLKIRMPKGRYLVVFEKSAEDSTKTETPSGNTKKQGVWFASRNPVFIFIMLIAMVLVFFYWKSLDTNPDQQAGIPGSAMRDSKPLIAVLPFRNMVSEDTDDSIAYGLTEDIITDLGNLPTLEVISLTSLLPFKDMDINPLDISTKLGAHYVMSGSVRGTPPELRITAQLYDAVNGIQIWAERFDWKMTSELVLQDEITRSLVHSLSAELQLDKSLVPLQRSSTDPETWSLFKQAVSMVNPPSEPTRLNLSLKAFEQITRQDPDFAGGYAGIAYVHAFKAFFERGESLDYNVQKALQMAELAQAQDPSFGLSYSAQAFAFLVNRDFEQALIASGKAIQLSPNDPYVMAYHGYILCASGESEKGIAFVETALRLDPLNARTPYLNILGVVSFYAGHYQVALQAFQRNRERGGPLGPGIQHFVAASYAALGDNANANAALSVAGLLDNVDYDWEDWIRRSWKNQEDSDHILKLIEQTRLKAVESSHTD
jgi:adenylate cyclase